jgi:hypothetical protein
MNVKDIHAFEQSMASLLDIIPHYLFSFYNRLLKEGFNDEQAMVIILKQLETLTIAGFASAPKEQDDG